MKIQIFLTLGMMLVLMVICEEIRAEETSVINVHRNIQLSESDPVVKDFYIDAGEGSGLKKNMVVQAVRKVSIRDASGVHAYGEIKIPVGQLKIIAVYPKLTVAREYKLLSREDLPMLDQIGIMTGDQIELKGSFIDRKPNSLSSVIALPSAKNSNSESPNSANSETIPKPQSTAQLPTTPPITPSPPAAAEPATSNAPPTSIPPATAEAKSEAKSSEGDTLN